MNDSPENDRCDGTGAEGEVTRALDPSFSARIADLEAKNAELCERNQHLEAAVDAAEIGTWLWQPSKATFEWDSRMRTLFGLEEDEVASREAYLKRVHPDDREAAARELELITASPEPGGAEVFPQSVRIIHPEFGERWISSIGRIDRGEDGGAIRLIGVSFDITELKQGEDRLRRSEEKYRSLNQSMMDGFAVADMGGRFTETNRAFQEMVGYSKQELDELTYSDITPDNWHALELEILETQVLPRGFSDLFEKEYICKSGLRIAVELRAYVIRKPNGQPESVWTVVREITARKKAEQSIREWNETLEKRVELRTLELQQSESRFRQLADATFDGISVVENGILLDGNAQVAKVLGCELSELLGQNVLDYVAPESKDMVTNKMRSDWEGVYEFVGVRKGGHKFPGEAHATIGTWYGRKARFTAIRDLTKRKEREKELQQQRDKLNQMMRMAVISEVSAGIVHQISQPLTAMGVNLAVISKRFENCTLCDFNSNTLLSEIEAEVVRMRDVIRQLKDLAKPTKGNADSVAIRDVLVDAVHDMREQASAQEIDLRENLHELLPDLQVDRVQMGQVMQNLLQNGIEATAAQSRNGRSITVAARPLDGDSVELTVSDNGVGLSPEVLTHLFLPFFSTKSDGMGIGLRLSQTIVHAHGGLIEGYNNVGGPGATFRIVLPQTESQ